MHCVAGTEVNLDGLKKGADFSSTISVQTLFTRTLRSLMFDNEKMVELVSQVGVTHNLFLHVANLGVASLMQFLQ